MYVYLKIKNIKYNTLLPMYHLFQQRQHPRYTYTISDPLTGHRLHFNFKRIESLRCISNNIYYYEYFLYELSNFDHMLGVVSQTRVSGGNRTHDPHANSLADYPLDHQGTRNNNNYNQDYNNNLNQVIRTERSVEHAFFFFFGIHARRQFSF